MKASAWFDQWCSISPLAHIVSARDIHRAGFSSNSLVRDIILENSWAWPNFWYPILTSISAPNLSDNVEDRLVWKMADGCVKSFSVSLVWDCIRPRGHVVDWFHLVWFSHRIPRHTFHLWLVMRRRLRTQDLLRSNDPSSDALVCSLCKA